MTYQKIKSETVKLSLTLLLSAAAVSLFLPSAIAYSVETRKTAPKEMSPEKKQRIECRKKLDDMYEPLIAEAKKGGPKCLEAAYQGAKFSLLFKCGFGTTDRLWKIRDQRLKEIKKTCKGLPEALKCQGNLKNLETCRDQVLKK